MELVGTNNLINKEALEYWRDAGLAVTLMLTHLPYFFARSIGRMDLAEEFAGKPGCWSAPLRRRPGDGSALALVRAQIPLSPCPPLTLCALRQPELLPCDSVLLRAKHGEYRSGRRHRQRSIPPERHHQVREQSFLT